MSDKPPSDHAELQREEARSRRRGVALLLGVAVLLVVGTIYLVIARSGGETGRGCTADGRLGPNGQTYGRDPARDCHFVDEHGNDLGG